MVDIEAVLVNVNDQDKRFFVLTEDGIPDTETGYFDSYEDALYSAEYAIAKDFEEQS